MSKKKQSKFYPIVSVCTPTFNRRPFINTLFECFKNQTYPQDKIEWIIVDDGTDKIKDLIESSGISQIKYYELDVKITLGAKRNLMHEKTSGDIIVYMDDDDYYPPERIQHAVEMLMSNKEILVAGSSEMYIYFKHINKMFQCGPYNNNHATAATFAFKKELLKITKYNDTKSLSEERDFLKDYTIPMIQLDPIKTILVFSHIHNTFDKKELLNQQSDVFKTSDKTVEHFIKFTKEAHIKKFFMLDIEKLLQEYEPGSSKYKPDVLKQIREIKNSRLNKELKIYHSKFIRCVNELENNISEDKPATEMECLKKLNMDLIIQVKKLNISLKEKEMEIKKLKDREWDLLE
jgi:glycosyltransferase involved in cell wall biosynthesis